MLIKLGYQKKSYNRDLRYQESEMAQCLRLQCSGFGFG